MAPAALADKFSSGIRQPGSSGDIVFAEAISSGPHLVPSCTELSFTRSADPWL
jgi:hypothetical protein